MLPWRNWTAQVVSTHKVGDSISSGSANALLVQWKNISFTPRESEVQALHSAPIYGRVTELGICAWLKIKILWVRVPPWLPFVWVRICTLSESILRDINRLYEYRSHNDHGWGRRIHTAPI